MLFNFFKKEKVIVRIAPSPTGNLHIGTARTALFNYLFAKKHNGTFILRIEDTDKERSKKEFETSIIEGLKWLGIEWSEFMRQSERGELYRLHLNRLLASGKIYESKEEPKEEGQRSSVIRFKNPNKEIVFYDEIRGKIKFDTTDLGDFVVAKSVNEPLYHFAVVVDDFESGVTHIIRGEDHISNTPRQILIQEALGAPRPKYAHLPLILAPDRSKLSKRHGATDMSEYKTAGYFSEAMVNFLALLGWNPGGDKEIFSLDELIKEFDLKRIQKGGAVFNIEKLNWYNREYLKKIPLEKLVKIVKEQYPTIYEELIIRCIPIILERLHTISELKNLIESELTLDRTPEYDTELLFWKKDKSKENTKRRLLDVRALIEKAGTIKSVDDAKNVLWNYVEKEGKGEVLWPLRVALSGLSKSPDPFELLYIRQKDESLKRIDIAITKLNDEKL